MAAIFFEKSSDWVQNKYTGVFKVAESEFGNKFKYTQNGGSILDGGIIFLQVVGLSRKLAYKGQFKS